MWRCERRLHLLAVEPMSVTFQSRKRFACPCCARRPVRYFVRRSVRRSVRRFVRVAWPYIRRKQRQSSAATWFSTLRHGSPVVETQYREFPVREIENVTYRAIQKKNKNEALVTPDL